jgi:hypothetical protein
LNFEDTKLDVGSIDTETETENVMIRTHVQTTIYLTSMIHIMGRCCFRWGLKRCLGKRMILAVTGPRCWRTKTNKRQSFPQRCVCCVGSPGLCVTARGWMWSCWARSGHTTTTAGWSGS